MLIVPVADRLIAEARMHQGHRSNCARPGRQAAPDCIQSSNDTGSRIRNERLGDLTVNEQELGTSTFVSKFLLSRQKNKRPDPFAGMPAELYFATGERLYPT